MNLLEHLTIRHDELRQAFERSRQENRLFPESGVISDTSQQLTTTRSLVEYLIENQDDDEGVLKNVARVFADPLFQAYVDLNPEDESDEFSQTGAELDAEYHPLLVSLAVAVYDYLNNYQEPNI